MSDKKTAIRADGTIMAGAEKDKSRDHLNAELAQATVKMSEDQVRREEELVQRVTDARNALDICSETTKQSWFDWKDQSTSILNDFRMWRMAMDSEIGKSMSSFADVRKFFLSEDHEKEVSRIREFVEICERLQKLKESGFLDQVADTILKLEERQ